MALIKFVLVIWLVLLPVQIAAYFASHKPSAGAAPGAVILSPNSPIYGLSIVIFCLYITCATLAALSIMGGWYKLSRAYPAPKGYAEGEVFGWQSAVIGFTKYNNALTVRVGPKGLYLSCPFLLQFMHPPILIPWTEIKAAQHKTIVFKSVLSLTVGSPTVATVGLVKKKLLDAVEPFLPQQSKPNS